MSSKFLKSDNSSNSFLATETGETLTTRLSTTTRSNFDFISIIIISSVVIICFIVCFVMGCRKKKNRPPDRDILDAAMLRDIQETELRTETGRQGVDGSRLESPPPTYSGLGRQTSFTSDISHISSQIEIPPDYYETTGNRMSTQTSIQEDISSDFESVPLKFEDSTYNEDVSCKQRSRSTRTKGSNPSHKKPFRSKSDSAKIKRSSNQPQAVSEEDAKMILEETISNSEPITEMINEAPIPHPRNLQKQIPTEV